MNRKIVTSVKKGKVKCQDLKNIGDAPKTATNKKEVTQLLYPRKPNERRNTKTKRKKQFKENSKKKRIRSSCSQFRSMSNGVKSEEQQKIYQSSADNFFPQSSSSKIINPMKISGKIVARNSEIQHTYLLEGDGRVRQPRQYTNTSESNGSQSKRKRMPCKIIKCSKIPFPVQREQRKLSERAEQIKLEKFDQETQGISEIKMCDHDYFPSESQINAFDL